MHKLDRLSATEPTCLDLCDHTQHHWNDSGIPLDKAEVRESLGEMQGTHCAYCDCEIYSGGHIEHFRRKNSAHFPELMFQWDNLFLSCDSNQCCGHYKDRGGRAYNPNDIIKPDVDDPDEFFYFYATGDIGLRGGISDTKQHRANETIRVFNLRHGPLKNLRKRALEQYKADEPGILDALMEFEEEERIEFINEEIENTKNKPHSSVIRHFFEKVI